MPGTATTSTIERRPLRLALILFATGFACACLRVIFVLDAPILWGDELFYFFQARHLLQGELIWFDNTVPFLSPLVLSPFSFSLVFMRLWAGALMAGAGVLFFFFVRGRTSTRLALLAWALWMLHSQAIFGVTLYSETVFFGLSFAYLLLWDRTGDRPRMQPVLALLLGAILLTRPLGAFWALALGLERLIRLQGRIFKDRKSWLLVLHALLGAAIYLAWVFRGGFAFVDMMLSTPSAITFPEPYIRVPGQILGWLVLAFGLAGMFAGAARGLRFAVFLLAGILFSLGNGILISNTFPRHFVVLVPIFLVFGAGAVLELWQRLPRKAAWFSMGLLLVAFACEQWFIPLPGSLNRPLSNHYYLEAEGCQDVRELQMECQGQVQRIQTPYLDQPPGATCRYQARLELPWNDTILYSAFIDDVGRIGWDGIVLGQANAWDASVRPLPGAAGAHQLEIHLANRWGFGGIGQLLVCPRPLPLMPTGLP